MIEFDEFTKDISLAVKNLRQRGAFLTVKDEKEINTMTIGWGNLGYQWGKCVFSVLVRKHRHTFSIIENAKEFTVTIPLDDAMKKEVAFCGTKSGRDYDKFKECSLELINGKTVMTPVINRPNVLTYECKIIYKQEMNPEFLCLDIDEQVYPKKDYHVMYVGEVQAVYKLG